MNFVNTFLEYTKIYESPTSFWRWSAYSAIGAVMRDSCYKDEGDTNLYPNIFVLLMADSAIQRKAKPIKMVEEFINRINNTKVISGRSSVQAILDELHKGETDKETGKIKVGGSAIFIAPELSAGVVADPQAVSIITDIYDYHDAYQSRLRGSGTFTIKKVCFSMLAASNKALLMDVYDQRAVHGGLLGRTFLVIPNEFRPANSLFEAQKNDPDREGTKNKLNDTLLAISKLSGPFLFCQDAKTEYDSWYKPFRESYKDRPDKSGIAGRIHTGVMKLAMILAVNSDQALVVRKEHVEESITECMSLMPNYTQLIVGTGKSDNAEIGMIVLNDLYTAPDQTLSRKKILQRHWSVFNDEQLDRLIATLVGGGLVKDMFLDDGIYYRLTEKCVEMLFSKKK